MTQLAKYPPGPAATGSVSRNEWKYFNYTMSTYSSNIFISLKETGGSGQGGEIWLFASENIAPTIRSHDYSDVRTNTPVHTIAIQRPLFTPLFPSTRNTIIIGVYGGAFMRRQTAEFQLVAWDF